MTTLGDPAPSSPTAAPPGPALTSGVIMLCTIQAAIFAMGAALGLVEGCNGGIMWETTPNACVPTCNGGYPAK